MATWLITIDLKDVFHNDDMSFVEKRDEIVSRIRNSPWFQESDVTLGSVIADLAETENVEDFDFVWNYVYDIADADRVWLATF